MAEKTLNARIVHKHDVEANWLKATNFTPKQGELIVYDKDASHDYERIKIGDGSTNVNSLPFVNDALRIELLTEIESLTDGTTTVKNAEHATSADSATTADTANAVAWTNVTGKPSTYTPATHNHNDTYYTETEIDTKFANLVGDTAVSTQISNAIANKVDKVSGKGLSTNDYTTTEKNKLSGIASGAEVNQNAFSNIAVGSTTIAADAKTDTLTLVAGDNVTITPDATNDKITITAKDTVYTHPTHTAKNSGLYKITVDGKGHVSAATAVAKSDITGLGIPAQDTTYSAATTSAAGLMSASDKSKLDGIATGANKITIDSSLSSTSTNPVQNKVVNTAISNLNTLVGDTSVAEQISDAVSGKANTSDLTSHTGNKSNPHSVTKSQVGLSNVPNVATNDQTPTYSDTTTFATLTSGEKLSAAFAKIKLAITNLINHIANVSNPHSVTKSQIGLGNVENKSSATIRGEITKANVTDALGYTPPTTNTTYSAAGSSLGLVKTGGDVAISDGVITVNDDSHNHIIGNVDGLQTALDAKAATSTVTALQQLVGDTAVSTQITNAVSSYIPTSQKGVANGVAQLDANGKVPTAQLPSYVDDVIEGTWVSSTSFKNTSGSTLTGETGKIYVDTATNKTYRWSGSAYVEISASLALGTTSSTAYRGDYGNTAYTHSQKTSGNPHNVTKSDVGLGNVENKSSATIRGELTKTNVTDALGYTPPTTNTTYSDATISAAGLMSATDKSTLDNLKTLVGDTAVATQISSALDAITYEDVGAAPSEHTHDWDDVSQIAGKNVEGQSFTVDGVEKTAGTNAEVFNDYRSNIASGDYSHAEGADAIASGNYSHAEGYETTASGYASHAEGSGTVASQGSSHAEGLETTASGYYSHAEGANTIAASIHQHVQGKYNVEDTNSKYAHIVGNGSSSARSNAHTLDWNGTGWFAGDVYVGGTGQDDASAKKLATMDMACPIITTAGTGAAYTATVPSITSLTAGVSFIMIPHTVSTSTQPTLDVNGLGAKKILRRTTAVATGSQPGASANWLLANYPFRVIYDGTVWIVEGQAKPAGSDVSGTVAAATKATQDGSGNVITSTYATKAEVTNLVGDTSVSAQIAAAIGAMSSEPWTFTLEDGTTVTKTVVVK